MIHISDVRSGKLHRYYWTLLGHVAAATDMWSDKNSLHNWLKFQLGMYREVVYEGKTVYHMESTDYASMDHDTFQSYVERCFHLICEATQIDISDLRREAAHENREL